MRLLVALAVLVLSMNVSFAFVTTASLVRTNIRPFTTTETSATDNNNILEVDENGAPFTWRRRQVLSTSTAAAATAAFMLTSTYGPQPAAARLEAVNRPDLLPNEKGLNVIQTETFLTKGQTKRLNDLLTALERDTGYRVRVLCQAYPNTPGLAIRDYWDLGKVRP